MPKYRPRKGDPVSFTTERGLEKGHVILCENKWSSQALVGSQDLRVYRIPIDLLSKREDSPRIKNLKFPEPNKSRFTIGDLVTFPSNRTTWVVGRVVKLNPKNAKIDVDGGSWSCPYVSLLHSIPLSSSNAPARQSTTPTFKPSDPVSFRSIHGDEIGHIASLNRSSAMVVTEEEHEFEVPIKLLKQRQGVPSKRVRTRNEKARLEFNAGDWVRLTGKKAPDGIGRIVKLNPKYAQVNVDGQLWKAPYVGLRQADAAVDRSSNHSRLEAIESEASALLMKHDLSDWHLRFDHAERRGGQCRYQEKLITMSERFALEADSTVVTDTILHEIAHALVGPAHGHDAVWKKTALSIGCTGRVYHTVDFSTARWIMTCEKCGWRQPRMRRVRNALCKECNSKVAFYSNVSIDNSASSEGTT